MTSHFVKTLPGADDLRGPDFGGIRTYEITANVTGRLEGSLEDWPAQMQDTVYLALERKAEEVGRPLAIIASVCDWDEDHGWYVRIVASEIVVKVGPRKN